MEEWRKVENWEFYEVSNLGRVRSLDRVVDTVNGPRSFRGRVLATNNADGYCVVNLCESGARKCSAVHVLVARAFLGEPSKGHEVCHRDGNKKNPRLDNLRYGTPVSNSLDRHEHGTIEPTQGVNNFNARLTEAQVREARHLRGRETTSDLAERFDVTKSTISKAQRRKTWMHVA